MEKLKENVEKVIIERFGKDSLIALATVEKGVPYVRTVDGYYDNHAFYVLTYALSNKMMQIAQNPVVAISGECLQHTEQEIIWGGFVKRKMNRLQIR